MDGCVCMRPFHRRWVFGVAAERWQVMPAINRLLMAGDSEVLSHACSALSHLCDGSAAHIKVCM